MESTRIRIRRESEFRRVKDKHLVGGISFKKLTLLLAVLGSNSFLAANCESLQNPDLSPSGRLILTPGEDLILNCKSSNPIGWDFSDSYKDDPRLEIENSQISDIYESKLRLKNVTFLDAMSFLCILKNKSSDIFYWDYLSKADVFIDDGDELLVYKNEGGGLDGKIIPLSFTKGTRDVIPFCRPTHPDVTLKLLHNHSPLTIVGEGERGWSYSDTIGFTLDPVVQDSIGLYECLAERKKKIQSLHYYLQVFTHAGSNPEIRHEINSTLAKGVGVGGNYELDCDMETSSSFYYILNWSQPLSVINSGRARIELIELTPKLSQVKKFRSKLIVKNALKSDGDEPFVCLAATPGVNRSLNDTISIYAPGEEFLEMSASKDGSISANAKEKGIWIVDIRGFPIPHHFSWTNSKLQELDSESRYKLFYNLEKERIELSIEHLTMQDGGNYTLTATNGFFTKVINLYLNVKAPPEVYLTKTRSFYMLNKTYDFRCKANGFPYPNLSWYFEECDSGGMLERENCSNPYAINVNDKPENIAHSDGLKSSVQKLGLTLSKCGYLLCEAINSLGFDMDYTQIILIDFIEDGLSGFGIHSLDNKEVESKIVESENSEIFCSVSKNNYTDKITWFYKGEGGREVEAQEVAGIEISSIETKLSFRQLLKIPIVNFNHSGTYRCEAHSLANGNTLSKSIDLRVQKREEPFIYESNLNGTQLTTTSTWNYGKLFCKARGVPTPHIAWYKDDVLLSEIPRLQDEVIFGGDFIDFKGLTSEYSGKYSCVASNSLGQHQKYIDILVNKEGHTLLILIITALLIVLSGLFIYVYIMYRKQQKIKRWVKKLKLDDFENGDVEKINPEDGVENQVNLLPYDKKFEFPREKLKLGVRIGSGAFGQVVRAEAHGISESETHTTVAVKMVKPNSDDSHFTALMSELKIMIHLGQHVNVVNLLGACTKQLVKKRELFVIVEYCKYGSLLSYMHRHRNDFVDQLDSNGEVVGNLRYPFDERAINSPDPSGDGGPRVVNGYQTMRQLGGSGDYGPMSPKSLCTDESYVSASPSVVGTDGRKRTSSSSTWNGHYKGIYQDREVEAITTTDLMCWAFQIARGMDYLASRKVLHGDLAARNVLLSENNIVKICDFGLAREMYKKVYQKQTESPLPIKWMALESICYRVFSTQSDVWSFGVVMWELFTLGKNPYPGMEPDEGFYKSLSQGYRMEKPGYAPSPIYDLMCACWDKEPSSRPSFSALADRIGDLMTDRLRQHYIDLNSPYLDLNVSRFVGKDDILKIFSPPDFSSRRHTPDRSYANLNNLSNLNQSDGYLTPNHLHLLNTQNNDYLTPISQNNDYLAPVSQNNDYLAPVSQNNDYLASISQNNDYLAPVSQNNDFLAPISQNNDYLAPISQNNDYLAPISQNNDYLAPISQNNSQNSNEPFCSMLANNAGYVFMKNSAQNETDANLENKMGENVTNGKNSEENGENYAKNREEVDNLENVKNEGLVGGISNLTYIESDFFPKLGVENHEIEKDVPNFLRHKNDSGVSSIDSNYEQNLKRTTPPNIFLTSGGDCIRNSE